MKTKSAMHTVFKLVVLGICSALASTATAQSGPAEGTLLRPNQKPSSTHAVLAVVVRNDAPVYPNSSNSHAVSVCPKGRYLTVTGETKSDYRVLAPGNKGVYVAKVDVKLLGYQVPLRQPRH